MRSESKEDIETSTSKSEGFIVTPFLTIQPSSFQPNTHYTLGPFLDRSGVLLSGKSGSSRHPSSSPERRESSSPATPPLVVPQHREKENPVLRARVQSAKGIAHIFDEEEEPGSPLQPRTQRHVSDSDTGSLHGTEASPSVSSAQGTKHGGKRLSRRHAEGSMTSKKHSKSKAREAPRFLGDRGDGDDELLLKDDKKGKPKGTVPDEKEIEAFLADASSGEESTKKRKKRKSKFEKSEEPKEKVGDVRIV